MSATFLGRSWYSGIFVALIVLLVMASFLTRSRLETIKPPVVDGSTSGFSARNAKGFLSYILGDESPHPVDSAANHRVAQRIVEVLGSLGYHAEVQDVTSCRTKVRTCARVRNIVAVRDGAANNKAILVSAHYDSVPAGPGASDDGTGVAIMLEVARLLNKEPAGKHAVIFLFTDGEEPGLLGAEAFASRHPLAGKVGAVINIEARGTSGQSVMFETGWNSGWLVDAFASASRRPLANSLIAAVYTLLPNDTDFSVFKARDMQGLNFAYGEHSSYYHTPLDNLRELDSGSLQQQGDNVFDVLETLVNAELPAGNAMGRLVYTDILGLGMVYWPTWVGPVAASFLVIVFAFACWRLRRYRDYKRGSVAIGLLGFFVSLVVGAGVAYALTYVLSLFHGVARPWHVGDGFNRTFLWSTVLLCVVSVQRLLARQRDAVGMWVGLGWAWLLMALATAVGLPSVSYLFLLPALLFAISVLVALASARRSSDERLYWIFAIPALAGFAVIVPAIHLIELMVGFHGVAGIAAMGAFLGLAATYILPFAQSRQAPRVYTYASWLAVAALVVSGALSFRAAAYTIRQPQSLNVMYVQDREGRAVVIAGDASNRPPDAMLQAMGKDVALNAAFPWSSFRFYRMPVQVPATGMPSATLDVLERTRVSRGWRITARIDADPRASAIQLFVPEAAGLRSIETDGQRIEYPKSSGDYAWFSCRGDSCNGRDITLTLSDVGHDAIVVAISKDLPEVASAIARRRGAEAVPQHDGDRSLVLKEVRL